MKSSSEKMAEPLIAKEAQKGIRAIEKEEKLVTKKLQKESKIVTDRFHLSGAYKTRRKLSDFFRLAKSGTITGAADNDPAGIVTYTQVGALAGYSLLWLMLLSLPMLSVVEEMSARVGVITKKGINLVVRENYGFKVAVFLALITACANILTIGADLAGMAEVFHIITGYSSAIFVVLIALALAYLLVQKNYKVISRYLFLLTPIFLLYIVSGVMVNPEWGEIVKNTFIPSFPHGSQYLMMAVGLLGTTISPYLIFWQASEEIEDHKGVRELRQEDKGVWLGMLFAHIVFYFIIIASGAVFFGQDKLLQTAGEAAQALQPAVGIWAMLFYSLGIIGAGIIAVPVLAASTGYVIKDAMHWAGGLNMREDKARSFYTVIILALMVGLVIALCGIQPVKALVYSQVLNGFLMPFLLFALMKVCNNRKILGKFVNNIWSNIIGWLAILVMLGFDIVLVFEWLK